MDNQTERMYDLMRKESNRLKTFQMNPPWPKDYVDIKKLAKAGFFYTFSGDNVHCAFCRGQVCRWDREDDPLTEHARHFTTCPFIMGGEVGNEPLGEDPFPGPKRPRPYDVCGYQHRSMQEHHAEPATNNIEQYNYTYTSNHHQQETAVNDAPAPVSSLTGICKICYTNSIELVFLPCGHSLSCLSCAQRLHSCPCCRAVITTRIRTFLV